MRSVIISVCLLFCSAHTALLAAAPSKDRIDFYYGIAEGNFLVGDLNGAERGIEQILRIDPDHVPALTLKTRVMLDRGKAATALEAAERAMELEPKRLEHTLLKALALGQLDRRDEATDIIETVIAQATPASENAKVAHQLLGLLRMAEGEWDQAAAAFNEIYLSDPQADPSSLRLSSEAFLEKTRILLTKGDPDGAIAAIDQAIAVYEGKSGKESLQQKTSLRMTRARLLAQIGRPENAIRDLQVLTGQQPENFEALITLASLYASVNRWESVEELIPAMAARPELEDVALYFEGRAALTKNRVGRARAKFEAAIEALPQYADSLRRTLYFYRGVCLDRLGRTEEADQDIINAMDAGYLPETTDEAILACQTLLRSNRSADAVPILEAFTLNRNQADARAWAMLGRAHLAEATLPLALSAFSESLRIDSDQPKTLALRGSILRKIGDLEGALGDYEAAHRLGPSNPVLSYEKGLLQLQLGRVDKAETELRIASRKLEAHPTLDLLHATVAFTIGATELAKASLGKYLEGIPTQPVASAHYLALLMAVTTSDDFKDPVIEYFNGNAKRKEVLDWAGIAANPKLAKQQICAAAFWMAQHEKTQNDPDRFNELLRIAVDVGQPDLPEFQLAHWLLEP